MLRTSSTAKKNKASCLREESNLDLSPHKRLFWPLNYTDRAWAGYCGLQRDGGRVAVGDVR